MRTPLPEMSHELETPDDVTGRSTTTIEQQETEALVLRAQSGDREAYPLLFNRFHDEIYRFAARRLGDPEAAQDAAAETFADAFGGLGRFRARGAPFEAWLYTIARRRVVDQLRVRARHEHDALPEVVTTVAPHADHAAGIATHLHMRALIARLPETERDVIELRFMEDLDVEHTALRLGKQPGAIRVAQHRALQKLRTMMSEVDS
jgi:RNA polymerase sigma-70 factor, ECF subfamily